MSKAPPGLPISLPVHLAACAVHREPLNPLHPTTTRDAYVEFAMEISMLALTRGPIWEGAQRDLGNFDLLNALIVEHGPLCGLVDAATRLRAYKRADRAARFGASGLCHACGKWQRGAPYHAGEGTVHACFRCVAEHRCWSPPGDDL